MQVVALLMLSLILVDRIAYVLSLKTKFVSSVLYEHSLILKQYVKK